VVVYSERSPRTGYLPFVVCFGGTLLALEKGAGEFARSTTAMKLVLGTTV
jgi:hypothetical protein